MAKALHLQISFIIPTEEGSWWASRDELNN